MLLGLPAVSRPITERASHEVYFTKDEASIREDQAKAEAERARKAKQDQGWLGYVGFYVGFGCFASSEGCKCFLVFIYIYTCQLLQVIRSP